MTTLLFTYQADYVAKSLACLEKHSCMINPSDPGTGKTYTSAAIAKKLGLSVFVVCPKSMIGHWFDVCDAFGVHVLGAANYETIKLLKYYHYLEMFEGDKRVQCPYIKSDAAAVGGFTWNLPASTLLIFDEAHKGKNYLTLNSRIMIAARASVGPDVKILILSATIADDLEDLKVLAFMVGEAQCEPYAFRAWLRVVKSRYPGKPMLSAVHETLYPEYGPRMCVEDLKSNGGIANFPNNDTKAETYDVPAETAADILSAYSDIEAALAALRLKQVNDGGSGLVALLRARQKLEMLKVPTILRLAVDTVTSGGSAVIFVNYRDTLELLRTNLSDYAISSSTIMGGQSAMERKQNIAAFQDDSKHAIVAMIQAGGVGVSLHDMIGNRPRTSIISPPWSSIELKQALGRTYRAGARTPVVQRIVFCKNQVENLVAEALNRKLKTIEWINSGNTDHLLEMPVHEIDPQ